MIDQQFKLLRRQIRSNGKSIVDLIKRNHFEPGNFANEGEICVFCGNENEITKEHVLPKWSFLKDPNRTFVTKINESQQTFNRTTIPACKKCNNELLSYIENHIHTLFKSTNLNESYYEESDSINIIRWLELIDYKFHILNFRKKFIRASEDFIPFLKDVPLSVMRESIDYSPYKALSQLRRAQSRLKRKDKDSRYFSMVVYKSKNSQPLFFHTLDEHIYLEFPEYQMAIFYFYNKEYESNFDAEKEAMEIISNNYSN